MLGRRILPLVARIGVRPQLSLVAIIAILPLLAVLLVGVIKNRELILQAATTRALDMAKLGAERQDDSFQDARTVLTMLRRAAANHGVHAGRLSCCASRDGRRLSAVHGDRNRRCEGADQLHQRSRSSPAVPQPQSVFLAAMAADPHAFVVGNYEIGPISGKPIVVAAAPLASVNRE